MSFNEQEGTCSCTLRRSSITQDIAREYDKLRYVYDECYDYMKHEVVLAERKLTVLRLCCRSIPLLIMCARIVVHSQGMVEGGSGVVLTWLAVSYFVRLQGEAQRQAISSYVLRNAAPLPGTAAGFLLLDEGYR
ncbi:hypothetical protein TIFTF001_044540 [Ficus carica]|uniref:Uncharacterized protein n=1 Tax=Ficus carica TaxID=3494 RepID=A0AA87ZFY2_FICCA|nr:hypothetical protein TIFTF001_044540 [Ficus carica]